MLADRVLHTTTTTGLSDYQLVDPTDPLYLSAVSSVSTGGNLVYLAVMASEWEICTGTVTAGSPATLTRTLIRSSTGALINWGAGTKTIRSIGQADVLRFGARGAVPTAGGTANAQTVVHPSPMRAVRAGMMVHFLPVASNTGATTINVDGLGAVAVVTPANVACAGGELRSGALASVVYDGTSWRLMALPATPLSTASAGLGQVVGIASTDGGTWTLPAGGTWEYRTTGYTTATGATNFQYAAGVAAGGTGVISSAGVTFLGDAKRIA